MGSEFLKCGCRPEHDEGKALVQLALSAGVVLFWTWTERKINHKLAAWAKARGRRPGVPDYIALSHPGLAVELKAECSRHDLSDIQRRVIKTMRAGGWHVIVAHGARDGIDQIVEWLEQRKGRDSE